MSSNTTESPQEQALRAQLAQMDAANAPILAAASAAVTSALNNSTGSNAAWNLSIEDTVTEFSLTLLDGAATLIPVANLTAAIIQSALEGSAPDLSGNVMVSASTDGSYSIELIGSLANTPEPSTALSGSGTGGTITITQTNPGNAPAGSDQNANIAAAQTSFNSALTQATSAMSTISNNLTTAANKTGAVATPSSLESSISGIPGVSVTSNPGAGDVLASDLNSQFASFSTALKSVLSAIDTLLSNDTTSGTTASAISNLKDASTALQVVGQQFYNQVQPGDQDSESEKAADLAIVQNMLS